MHETEMIVAIVGMGCGTGITMAFFRTVRAALERRGSRGQESVTDEMRMLRDEIRQLRQQNHDLVLGFDTTLQRVDHRLTYLETRGTFTPAEDAREAAGVRGR
jgi:hypothetical protein